MKKLLLLALLAIGGVSTVSADLYLKGGMNGWTANEDSKFVNGTLSVSLSADTNYEFKLWSDTPGEGTWYGQQYAGTIYWHNCTDWTLTSPGNNINIKTNNAGTYTFSWDGSKLSVTYPNLTTVYFCNNLNWSTPYVYLLGNTSYWNNDLGSGSKGRENGHAMTQIGTSNIWKLDYPSSINSPYIAFLKESQDNFDNFHNTEAVYRGDFGTSMPLFVPKTDTKETRNGTNYFNDGVWHTYPTYTRDVTSGNYGTICLPFSGTVSGATLYTIDSKIVNGNNEVTGINISEAGTSLTAGTAYIFKASGSELTVSSLTGSYTAAATGGAIVGNYESSLNVETGKHIIYQNKLYEAGTGVTIGQYKAYIDLDQVSPSQSRGANSIFFVDDVTGIESIQIENSESVMYNLQGQRVNNAQKGLVIVGGKKLLRK